MLTQYFVNARKVAQRKKELEKKMIEEMNKPEVVEEVYSCEEEVSEFDSLLRRNWFLNDYDIIDMMWEANEDVYEEIMNRIDTYPEHVQSVLRYAFRPPVLAKIKAKELTDEDMYKQYKAKQAEYDKIYTAAWEQYKKDMGMTRPVGELDDEYTDLYDALQLTKKKLEQEMKKPSKTYVPPHLRGTATLITPEIETLRIKIKNLENEIHNVKKEIEEAENNWENDRKDKFQSIFYKMLTV